MLESMVRIAPSQPNEGMARIAPRSPMISIANKKKSLDLCYVTFAAIYLSRAGVVGNVFAAALTQVSTAVMPPAVAFQNIGVGPGRGGGW
jgi:hypothetical protein